MYDRDIFVNIRDIDHFVCERRVAIDRFVDRRVQCNDLVPAPDEVAETIYKGCIVSKQIAQCDHIVSVPRFLERRGCIFGFIK